MPFQNQIGGPEYRAMLDRSEMLTLLRSIQLTQERIEERIAGIYGLMTSRDDHTTQGESSCE